VTTRIGDLPGEDLAMEDRQTTAAAAIRLHYDVGNDFYKLWLDSSLSYSCAIPIGVDDTLEAAQERKLRFHLDAVGASGVESILDVGCGWGAVLDRAASLHGVRRSVGLTLSNEQAEFVRAGSHTGVEVRTENWMDFDPNARFDGIISIGAFEHFATPDDSAPEKIRVYREFFTRCRSWLNQHGALSLQTIAYANMSRADANVFMQQEIFPDADLPTLSEIVCATEGLFEITSMENGRLDYAWTCEQWARRLRTRRDEAVELVGPEVVARYERYLKMSAIGFRMGKIGLLRLVLRPYPKEHFAKTTL
jgi:cyclopropane-fatty-acyl-phospholipid synthase